MSDLVSIVGNEHVQIIGESGYKVDDVIPETAVKPGTYEEVAAILDFANSIGLAVIPCGGLTMMSIGNVPSRYDLALDLSRLDQIVEYEPADLTITCQAGITVDKLREELGERGQMLPLVSSFDPWGTVGGVLAVNSWGAERYAFGSPRDFTIGMRVVTADGRITRAGGKVVKNVAGYDLCKLYIGSLGTLGVIVEATFKVQPMPKVSTQMVVGCETVEQCCSIAREVGRRGLSVWSSTIEHYSWDALVKPYLLWLSVAGTHAGVERTMREITDLASGSSLESWESSTGGALPLGRSWAKLDPEIECGDVTGLECKATVLPEQTASAMAALSKSGRQLHLSALPLLGLIRADWANVSPSESERIVDETTEIVRSFGGSMIVLFCDPDLKRRIDVFGDPPPGFELMRRIKQEFDPKGTLSPGRFLGRL